MDALVSLAHYVVVYDNLSTGHVEFWFSSRDKIELVEADILDILDIERLKHSMKLCDMVIHLAANADRHGGYCYG